DQPRFVGAKVAQDLSLVADEEHALVGEILFVLEEFFGRLRLHAAVVPERVDRRPRRGGGMPPADGARLRQADLRHAPALADALLVDPAILLRAPPHSFPP